MLLCASVQAQLPARLSRSLEAVKVGLIARADNGGLGAQTWEAFRHLLPDKTIVIDLSLLTGMPTYSERFPGAVTIPHAAWQQSTQWMDDFLADLDVVFTCETAYRDDFYSYARYKGVKTVLHANFEFLPWFTSPHLPKPDAFWMASLYRYNDVPATWGPKLYMPSPVDRTRCAFVERQSCNRFLHVVGRKTDLDRNGTRTVIESEKWRTTESKTIYTQARTIRHEIVPMPGLNVFVEEPKDYWGLYRSTEAFVSPRRYAGQSLTMQEALSCGLPVISLDIDPQSWWLPSEWLIPARSVSTLPCQSGHIEVFDAQPVDLAAKMDEFVSANDFGEYSAHANEIAKTLDWDQWTQPHLDALRDVAFSA